MAAAMAVHRGRLPSLEPVQHYPGKLGGFGPDLSDLAAMLVSPPAISPSTTMALTSDSSILDLLLDQHGCGGRGGEVSPVSSTPSPAAQPDLWPAGWPASSAGEDALPALPDIELELEQATVPAAASAYGGFGVPPGLVLAPPSSPSEAGSSSTASLEMACSDDGDSSGGETATPGPGRARGETGRAALRKKAAPARGRASAGKARPRWKCTPEFLVNSITPSERAKLAKVKGLAVPYPGEAVTKQHEKLLRKEIRKIRNVASAQRSRANQREYIATLEGKIDAVKSDNAELKSRNSTLSASLNEALQQLARLRAALTGPQGGPAALLMAAVCVGFVQPSASTDGWSWDNTAAGAGAGGQPPAVAWRSRSLLAAGADDVTTAEGWLWPSLLVAVCAVALLGLAVCAFASGGRRRKPAAAATPS